MEATTTLVSLSDLRKLLSSIRQYPESARIRFRALGQLWYPNFLRVLKIEQGRSVLFHDAIRDKSITLTDMGRIIQFELDNKQYQYEPDFHYQVCQNDLNEGP